MHMLYYVTDEQKSLLEQGILHKLLQARKNGQSVKVRYGKVLICGANAAGKTSFLNLLMEEEFQEKHKSTGVTDSRQAKVAFKAMASCKAKEICFSRISIEDERAEILSHLPPFTGSNTGHNNKAYENTSSVKNTVEKYTVTERMMAKEDVNASDAKFDRLENDQGNDEKIWDILTFVDTGGQPYLISMLPAVNSFAMSTFIVHNMTKDLDDDVKVIKDGEIIQDEDGKPKPYGCKHCQLIKTLASYASSIVLPDIQFLSDFKVITTSNKEKQSTSISLLGTHSSTISENNIQIIDNKLTKMFEHSKGLNEIIYSRLNDHYDYLIPVDNDTQGISSNKDTSKATRQYTPSSKIRRYLYDRLKEQDVYEVPLKWLILELEIRRECTDKNCFLITLEDVVKLGKDKDLGDENYIVSGLRFHHLFGVLLYFEEVKGMRGLVITNHQWLFDKLTKFSSYMRCNKGETVEVTKKFRLKGIFKESMIDIDELNIREDFKISGTNVEPKKSFLELLEYLRFIAPLKNAGQYFMPSVLPSYELAKLDGIDSETNELSSARPLLIQYKTGDKSGSFPRGFFCFLAVQLIINESKWDLLQSKTWLAYNNKLTFCNKPSGHHITLIDRISFLEIKVTHDKDKDTLHIHNEVFDIICNALKQVGYKFNVDNPLNYGFWCDSENCKQDEDHITYPYLLNEEEKLKNCQHCYCTHGDRTDLEETHRVWFKVSVNLHTYLCIRTCILISKLYVTQVRVVLPDLHIYTVQLDFNLILTCSMLMCFPLVLMKSCTEHILHIGHL